MDSTAKLIPISVIESILTDENVYLNFLNLLGDFVDINVDEYVVAINNYMKYMIDNKNDINEEVFIRVNNINFRNNTGIKYDYLLYSLKTKRLISIGIIEKILNDENTFNKFMTFKDNVNFFGDYLVDYLASIWQYISYMRNNNLSMSEDSLDRYQEIVREFSLDYKRSSFLAGEFIEEEMDDDFANSILNSVDYTLSKFDLALDIYRELCKRCSYDLNFFILNQDMSNPLSVDIYNKDASSVNNENASIVCRTWAVLYQDLLNKCGFKARVNGGFHKYVVFDCDGTLIKADGTNAFRGENDEFFLNDLVRSKLELPLAGFTCLENDKNIKKYLEENEKNSKSNKDNFQNFVDEYRSKYMKKNKLSFEQAFLLFNDKVKEKKLPDMEQIKYIDVLYRLMLKPYSDIQKDEKYVAMLNDSKFEASYLITFLDNDGNFNYFLYQENNGFKRMKLEHLVYLLQAKRMIVLNKDKEIWGLREELNNGYVK